MLSYSSYSCLSGTNNNHRSDGSYLWGFDSDREMFVRRPVQNRCKLTQVNPLFPVVLLVQYSSQKGMTLTSDLLLSNFVSSTFPCLPPTPNAHINRLLSRFYPDPRIAGFLPQAGRAI